MEYRKDMDALTFEDMQRADEASYAILRLTEEGGPLSKASIESMKAGGYEVTLEIKVEKTQRRLAVELLMSGDISGAAGILGSMCDAEKQGQKPQPAQEPLQKPQPVQGQEPAQKPQPVQGQEQRPSPPKGHEPAAKDGADDEDEFRKTRMETIRRVARKLYGDSPSPSPTGMKTGVQSKYPKRAMGREDADKFVDGYAKENGCRDVKTSNGACVGMRMLLDGRAVVVARILSDGTAMVNRAGTRYHSVLSSESLKTLLPVECAGDHAVRSGDRVSVSFCDVKDGPRTAVRTGVVSSVSVSGLAEVLMDDTSCMSTVPLKAVCKSA